MCLFTYHNAPYRLWKSYKALQNFIFVVAEILERLQEQDLFKSQSVCSFKLFALLSLGLVIFFILFPLLFFIFKIFFLNNHFYYMLALLS